MVAVLRPDSSRPDMGRSQALYSLWTDAAGQFTLNAATAGDPHFGTTVPGTWRAQARDAGSGSTSPVVTWVVRWYRVHLRQ